MSKLNTKKIIVILLAAALVLVGIIVATQKFADYRSSSETEYTLDPEIVKDLKENVGKGSSGDVIDITQETQSDGSRVYTLKFKDGTKQKVTVRKARDGESGAGTSNPGGSFSGSGGGKTEPSKPIEAGTSYEKFMNLAAEEKEAFFYTFDSASSFYSWYNSAYDEYQKLHPTIVVKAGEVLDLGERK